MQRALLCLWLVLVGLSLPSGGRGQETPAIAQPVTDQTGLLTAEGTARIAEKLVALREKNGAQMAVLVVRTTGGEPIEDYSLRVATAWGGGSKKRDDGILFVLAIDDRRMRLEVGYGLEAKLPDGRARAIIDGIKPELRAQSYDAAIEKVVDGVATVLAGGSVAADPGNYVDGEDNSRAWWAVLVIVGGLGLAVLIVFPLVRLAGRSIGSRYGSSGWSSYSSSDSSFSSSSNSSGWSGGGGSFGGGGASSSW